MLSTLSPHPRDSKIVFTEVGHYYTVDGISGKPFSVTGIIHKLFPEFNADEAISNMRRSPNWESSKYFGMTDDQIKELWDKMRDEAAGLGTAMHKAIEDHINGASYRFKSKLALPTKSTQTIEFGYFMNFWKDMPTLFPGFKPYRTEWSVFDEEKRLAGCIDLILGGSDDEIIIVDWKRSKEIKREGYGKGNGIFAHLDNCNYNHYCLQLNIYRTILEKNYGKKCVGMHMAIMHPNNPNYLLIPVPLLQKEMDDLWNLLPYEEKKKSRTEEIPDGVNPPVM